MPKSVIFARFSAVIRMFAGLTSRWTTRLACAKSSASATCAMMSARPRSDSGWSPWSSSFRLVPRTYSMAMKASPSSLVLDRRRGR